MTKDTARSATPVPAEPRPRRIQEIALELGLDSDAILPYGHHIAKVPYGVLKERESARDGHLILVSAMSPTPQGEGKVVDLYPLKQSVVVQLQDGLRHEFPLGDIQPWEEYEALRKKAQQPCPKHPQGGCSCAVQSDKRPAPAKSAKQGQKQTSTPAAKRKGSSRRKSSRRRRRK